MLALAFGLVALLYAMVGFGGGSSYLALMALFEIPYELMPKLGLICNLLVVSGGCWHFKKSGHFDKHLILPFVLSSVPMAFLGGMYPLNEKTFLSLLAVTLFMAGLRLLFVSRFNQGQVSRPKKSIAMVVGGLLGFLSGLVALGGGIFLAPLMLNLKWGTPKQVAATASVFIFLNSLAGLLGQMSKGIPSELISYWPLFVAVLIGGQIGSWIGSHQKISQVLIQRGTAVLILIVSSRLLWKLIH